MKDFLKWLGANEKVAKVGIWIFIFMAFLVMTNSMLESIGFPYYKITVNNLSKIDVNIATEYVFSWIINILNFYSTVLLVFSIKNYKKIFKFSIIFLILSIIINLLTNYVITQVFMLVYFIGFFFFYSKKNWKYILYCLGSLAINSIVQYICYLYKMKFIDYASINQATRIILSLDYFIVMSMIILVKEILIRRKQNLKNEEVTLVESNS